MLWHALGISTMTLAGIVCVFLPLLPGGYDAAAVLLSSIIQAVSFTAIVLVPLGLILFFLGRSDRKLLDVVAIGLVSVIVTLAAAIGPLRQTANRSPSVCSLPVRSSLFAPSGAQFVCPNQRHSQSAPSHSI